MTNIDDSVYDGTLKLCRKCEEELPRTRENWSKDKSKKDKLDIYCKGCKNALRKERRDKNKAHWEANDPFDGKPKKCPKCGQVKMRIKENWHKNSNSEDGLQGLCVTCKSEESREWYSRNWAVALIYNCRLSSKQRGHHAPAIDQQWVLGQLERQSGKCFWSGIPLKPTNGKYGSPDQASIDRLDNNKGYHPDNCVLAAWSINCLRGDKSAAEFAEYLVELFSCLSTVYGSTKGVSYEKYQ